MLCFRRVCDALLASIAAIVIESEDTALRSYVVYSWYKLTEVHGELIGFPETPVNLYQAEQHHYNMHMYHQANLLSSVLMLSSYFSQILWL